MEDKKLTPQESLDLISNMLQTTRRRYGLKDGNQLLYWGLAVVIISIAVNILMYITATAKWNMLWLLLVPAGLINARIKKKARITSPVTYTDRTTAMIWRGICITLAIMYLICAFAAWQTNSNAWLTMFISVFFVVGMGIFTQGVIIREKSLMTGGIFAVAMGGILTCYITTNTVLDAFALNWIFSISFFGAMVVPGFIMRIKAKREDR